MFTVLAIFAKNWPKWAIWLDVWKSPFKGWKSLKNLKVGVFETDFKQVSFRISYYIFVFQPVNILKAGDRRKFF